MMAGNKEMISGYDAMAEVTLEMDSEHEAMAEVN